MGKYYDRKMPLNLMNKGKLLQKKNRNFLLQIPNIVYKDFVS